MLPDLNRIKGIHPGAVLKRELKKRNIKSITLANGLEEHPQTINAITKERRNINPKLSYKLGNYFNISHDYFMLIQAAFEVSVYKQSALKAKNPLLGKFRPSLFWDTKIDTIDFEKNRKSIIQRILERGNEEEIKHLINLYSLATIKTEISTIQDSVIPNYGENIRNYITQED